MTKVFILTALCFLVLGHLFAEDIKLEHYNRENGLSHNSVRHILQDKQGMLWLGTFNGLNSFDGQRFSSFLSDARYPNRIQNDDITAFVFDQDADAMWIGTRGGLTKLNMRSFQFTTFVHDPNNPESIPDSEIRAVYVDKLKRIWIGTKSSGLVIFNQSTKMFTKIPLPGFTYVKTIFEDINGHIWVGSFDTGGVARLIIDEKGDIVGRHMYDLPVGRSTIVNPYLYFIFQDDKADLFVGTREGLFKWNKHDDLFELIPIGDSKFKESIGPYFVCIARAPDGRYWLGTIGGIIVCNRLEDIAKGEFKWYFSNRYEKTSLVDNSVTALYFDHSGLLWIGTDNGLDKYDPYWNQFKTVNSFSMVVDGRTPRISDYERTFDNKLLVGTHNSGLFLREMNRFKPIENQFIDIAGLFSIDGKIFFCGLSSGKLLVYNYVYGSSKLLDVGFRSVPIMAFCKLQNGNLLVGSHGNGAVELNPRTLAVDHSLQKIFPNASINQVEQTADGLIWFATENGVIKINATTGQSKIYTARDGHVEGLSNNSAKTICIDNTGKIWVSTHMGLNYYSPSIDDFVQVKSPRELKENWITDVIKDPKGYLWMNFNNGQVGRFDPSQNRLLTYDVGSGNRLDIFSNKGFFLFNDSVIYLTGKEEIIYFPINDLHDNMRADKPFISEVKIQNRTIWPGDTINGQMVLEENINFSNKLVLNYVNRNFALTFSSPSYANVKLNKYEYMLEGFDDDWIAVDNASTNIQYTNLYPNDYVFKVRYANSSGYWSDVSSYDICINPPFWLTYKAFLLAFALLILVIVLIYWQLKRSWNLKHELLLEKIHREREEKLNSEKLRLFTNISHELKTPISLILGPAKQLMESDLSEDRQQNLIRLILQNSNRLYNLVNQLLDFRKAQFGELTLKVTKTDILLYTRNIFQSFEGLADEKKINFHLICDSDELIGWIDNDKYDKILCNLLSNAIRFTTRLGNIDLFLGVSTGETGFRTLTVEVSDDGMGIPIESQELVFTRFYQVDKESLTGSGIGLSLVKSLVAVHKATIGLQSQIGKGSVFTISIPIDKEFYTENEIFDFDISHSQVLNALTDNNSETNSPIEEKGHVLVIEDNNELRDYLADYLSDLYTVHKAENGEQGLQICRSIKPTICIADVMMPIMDGFEFCRTLKNDERISHIPVLLLTALSDNENQIKGYKSGADGYLAKPFDPELLKTRINNIITVREALKKKFSADVDSNVDVLTHSPVDEIFLNNLTAIIDRHIADPNLSGNLFCSELGLSASTLYRRLKELTDLSPNEFIRTIRLKKAVQILKAKNHNVSEVADMVGFNDPFYFSRCFKKQFGFPPSAML